MPTSSRFVIAPRSWTRLAVASAVVLGAGGCLGDPGGDPSLAGGAPDASVSQPVLMAAVSDEAAQVLERVRAFRLPVADSRPLPPTRKAALREPPSREPVLAASPADWFERTDETGPTLRPHIPSDRVGRGAVRAELRYPERADQAVRVRDVASGLQVDVATAGLAPSAARVAEGYVVYPLAIEELGSVVHRPSPEGTEDFLVFERRPQVEEVVYAIEIGERVAGLRLVGSALELVDADGVPRLRMNPPWIADAEGHREDARVTVTGCAVDTDPSGPWGRTPTPPGARRCEVHVRWSGESLRYPAVLDPYWTTTANMAVARQSHTASVIKSGIQAGRVLVAGGEVKWHGTPTATAEIFDPRTSTFSMTGALSVARDYALGQPIEVADAMGSPLTKVLVAGGFLQNDAGSSASELYDPVTGTFSRTGDLPVGVGSPSSTVVASPVDGRMNVVFATGGTRAWEDQYVANAQYFDAPTNRWVAVAAMSGGEREGHMAEYVPDYAGAGAVKNAVVVAAGYNLANDTYLKSSEYFQLPAPGSGGSIAAGTWKKLPDLAVDRWRGTAVRLADHRIVMIAGYKDRPNTYVRQTEEFNPVAGTWGRAAMLAEGRYAHTASVLGCDAVVVAGGWNETNSYLELVEVYDPAAGTWNAQTAMGHYRGFHVGTVVTVNGARRLLVTGGGGAAFGKSKRDDSLLSAEIYTGVSADGCACVADEECASNTCCGGTCTRRAANGGACASACGCQSGICTDGVCCGSACGGACDVCAKSLGATADGTCTLVGARKQGSPGCGRYLCDGVSTSCPNYCLTAADCAAGHNCCNAACIPARAPGAKNTCRDNCDCAAGSFCVDGYCCNTGCSGACDRCDLPGTEGTCTAVPAGQAPASPGCGGYACDGVVGLCPATCVTNATCAVGTTCCAGKCATPKSTGQACAAGCECASGFCADGVCCNAACDAACDACSIAAGASINGTCSVSRTGSPGTPSCSPYTCNGKDRTCPGSCMTDVDCGGASRCCPSTRACNPNLKAKGLACTESCECAAGLACADGVCCDAACAGACDACTVARGATANGTCTIVDSTKPGALACCDGVSASCALCDAGKPCVGAGEACCGGACVRTGQALQPQGGACCSAADCAGGRACVDGVCCASACAGACDRCDVPGQLGSCVPTPAGGAGSPSCAPYLCGGVGIACPASCVSDAQCAAGSTCCSGRCVAAGTVALGGACCAAAQCAGGGACVDGFCCDTPCAGACQSCRAAGGAVANGTCTNLAGRDGSPSCAPFACAGQADCPSACIADLQCAAGSTCCGGRCVKALALGAACCNDANCGSGHCVDGVCCNATCAGACASCSRVPGTCTVDPAGSPGSPGCGGFVCDGVSANCPASCTTDQECGAGRSCCNGACVGQLAAGAACCSGGNCASGFCTDGVCCASRCDGACQACTVARGAAVNGTCANLVGKDGSPSCAPYACNGAATCPTSCAVDADCAAGRLCCGGACIEPGKGVPGQACGATDACCVSGYCSDGVCCDARCGGGCDACTKTQGARADGVCTILGKGDPGAPLCAAAACDGDNSTCPSCDGDGDCGAGRTCCKVGKGESRCVSPASLDNGDDCCGDSDCRSGHCSDNVCCAAECDGPCDACNLIGRRGECTVRNAGTPAQGVPGCTCDGESAFCGCTGDADCPGGTRCCASQCVKDLENGAACCDGANCKSGFCADGVCCDTKCDGSCEACNQGGKEGSCAPVTGAPVAPRACGDHAVCGGSCDGMEAKACQYPKAGTACGAAACEAGRSTAAAACNGLGECVPGAEMACADGCAADGTCAKAGGGCSCAVGAGGASGGAGSTAILGLGLVALLLRRRRRAGAGTRD